jgi:hypothetical protein
MFFLCVLTKRNIGEALMSNYENRHERTPCACLNLTTEILVANRAQRLNIFENRLNEASKLKAQMNAFAEMGRWAIPRRFVLTRAL